MGCGQSKIGSIYPKNKKNKSSSKKNGDSIRSASIEQKHGNGNAKGNKTNNNGAEVNRNEDQNGSVDKSQAKKKPGTPGSGPLLQQAEISSSQLDFFKMLDEKIENGPDYDESLDASARADRITGLLRRWELASMSWSNIADLKNVSSSTIKNQASIMYTSRQSLSAKDREGMRNIIGGRPESAPVYMTANRVDGLEESHSPSPSTPRHVLESISQSPTQSLKSVTPPGMSPTSQRYQEYRDCNTNHVTKITKAQYSHVQSPLNGDYVTQQNLYREQYLQQTGMLAIPPPYTVGSPGGSVLKNNPYVQQFQIAGSQHFPVPRKRDFNAAQMT